MTVEIPEFDQTVGQEMRLPCNNCATLTYHHVVKSVDVKVGLLTAVGHIHYQIIRCQGCKLFTYRTLTKTPDLAAAMTPNRKTKRIQPTEELYPERNLERRMDTKLLLALPHDVRRIYSETHRALLGRQQVLTGMGIRALVEAVCVERSATGNNLQAKIDGLVKLGLLTQGNADFLHSLRIMGNEAAHQVKPHGHEKLGLAMDIIDHLLTTVYVIPAKATKLTAPPPTPKKP